MKENGQKKGSRRKQRERGVRKGVEQGDDGRTRRRRGENRRSKEGSTGNTADGGHSIQREDTTDGVHNNSVMAADGGEKKSGRRHVQATTQ